MMTSLSQTEILKYECGYCNKSYKKQTLYHKHVILCEILRKSIMERKNENEKKIIEDINEKLIYELLNNIDTKNAIINKFKENMKGEPSIGSLRRRIESVNNYLFTKVFLNSFPSSTSFS